MEYAIMIAIGPGRIFHRDIIYNYSIICTLAILHRHVPGIRRRAVAQARISLLKKLEFVDTDCVPGRIVALSHIQFHITRRDRLRQNTVRDIQLIILYLIRLRKGHTRYSGAFSIVIPGNQRLTVIGSILQVKLYRIHVRTLACPRTVGMPDHPALKCLVFTQVNNRISRSSSRTPFTAGDNAIHQQMHRTVIGSCDTGNCGAFQGKVRSLVPGINKAILHHIRPANGESGRLPFDTILGIGDNLKFADILLTIPVKGSQVKSRIGGGPYKFPGSVIIDTENPVHKGIRRLLPIYTGFHNLIRRINHLVQRHIGDSTRSALVRCESHLPHIDGIILHAVRRFKLQGYCNGRLASVLPESIDRSCGPASIRSNVQRIELKILISVGIPKTQAQGDIHARLRRLINHLKFAL